MKIPFLDIDGVLLTRKSWMEASGSHAPADPDCVEALNHILESTHALIVVSSTWRYQGLLFMREQLANWGVKKGSILDCTPDCRVQRRTPTRGQEIKLCIDSAGAWRGVDSFVILDDDCDMAPFMDRLVRTRTETGLSMSHADTAIRMLLGAP